MFRRATDPEHPHEPLLPLRTAVILVLALVAGVVTGALSLWSGAPLPAALLAAAAATAGAIRWLDDTIAHR